MTLPTEFFLPSLQRFLHHFPRILFFFPTSRWKRFFSVFSSFFLSYFYFHFIAFSGNWRHLVGYTKLQNRLLTTASLYSHSKCVYITCIGIFVLYFHLGFFILFSSEIEWNILLCSLRLIYVQQTLSIKSLPM